jgi:hypothetical protein
VASTRLLQAALLRQPFEPATIAIDCASFVIQAAAYGRQMPDNYAAERWLDVAPPAT